MLVTRPSSENDPVAPLVSVIVPTWNRETLVTSTLESIAAQTERDFEIIVVDDGSTDGTVSAVQSFTKFEPRLRLMRHDHAGPGAARNIGIRSSQGRYLAFLDSDDLWEPDYLRCTMDALARDPGAGAVLTDWVTFGPGPPRLSWTARFKEPPADLVLALFQGNFMTPGALVIRRSVWAEVGPFAEDLIGTEDYDWMLRFVVKQRLVFLPKPLLRQRSHPDNIVSDPKLYRYLCLALERFVTTCPKLIPREVVRERLARLNEIAGGNHLLGGDFSRARTHLLRSLKHRPFRWIVWKGLAKALLKSRPRSAPPRKNP